MRGSLFFVFLLLVGIGAFRYQPWKDDWEMVRAMFGKGRHHSLVGEWEVVKTIAVNNQQGFVARDNVQKGSFKFTQEGTVNLDLVHPDTETSATGKYVVDGTTVAMRDLQTTGDTSEQIKSGINMNLAWTGSDDVIAMDKTEAIYLHRRKAGSPLATFMQMGLRKDEKADGGAAAGELRGVIGETKRAAQESDDVANNN